MTIPKIFIVALYVFLSFNTLAQNNASISKYADPSLTFSPPKNGTPSSVISSACDFPVTLTQSTSQTITSPNSVACLYNSIYHHDNSYWRVFTLSRALNVTSVEIGIEQAAATSGSQPLTVNIYENSGGAFPAGTRTLKGTANVDVNDQALTKLTIPISASLPSNAQMVLEVFTPDGVASESLFGMGSNSSGQNGPSYFSAASCSINEPATYASLGFPNLHLVMNVIGCEGSDIFVDADAVGANNGTSWLNAFTDLQDAMDAANTGDEIWVAAGTYLPSSSPDGSTNNNRDKSFHLSKNIKIYGGFAGTETMLSERDWVANETILSGDFDADDAVSGIGASLLIENNAENAYHVFMVKSVTSGTLDGFTISGGNANGSSVIQFSGNQFFRAIAGGIYVRFSSIILGNLNIKANAAGITGGIYINDGNNYTVTNSTISENVNGGIRTSSPITISSSIISGNKGPGIYLTNSTGSIIQNSIISFNSVGGVYDDQSNSKYINCTFYGNSAEYGGGLGLFRQYSVATIKNCIFWDNIATGANGAYTAEIYFDYSEEPTVQYCLMQAETLFSTGTGNINMQDPRFVDADNGFLQLNCISAAIDAGTANGAPTDDITGFSRVGLPDMGAYEYGQVIIDNQITNGTNLSLHTIPILKARSQILNTNNVLYQGINNVQLLPGFSVAPTGGAATVFLAEIGGGCE